MTQNGKQAFTWLVSSQAGQSTILLLIWALSFAYATGGLRAEIAGLRADVQRIEQRIDDYFTERH